MVKQPSLLRQLLYCAPFLMATHAPLAAAEDYGQQQTSGGSESATPDPLNWLARMNFPASSPLVRRVITLKALPSDRGELQVSPVDRTMLQSLHFLDVASLEDISWTDVINRRHAWAGRGVTRRLKALLQATGSQAILIIPPPGSSEAMALIRPDTNGQLDTVAQKLERLPKAEDAKDVAVALREMLGYDAIVLSHEGPYVLLQTPDLNAGAKLLHGVAIGNSATRASVNRETGVPTAFLRLSRSLGHYSVWRIVSATTPSLIPAGTKVLLESRARPERSPRQPSPPVVAPQ
ncbi:MAG: hypothetical protein FJ146_09650 [Deltaproteobacteria bacterium]|nr:hypothetical protein [Deltaproteobacteria bacterium]